VSLRPLAWVAVAVAVIGGPYWLGPSTSFGREGSPFAGPSLGGLIAAYGRPFLVLLVLGACVAYAGGPGLGSVPRALLGGEPRSLATARATHRLARAVLRTGAIVAFLAAFAVFLLVGRVRAGEVDSYPSPAGLAELIAVALLAPAVAVALARLVLAPVADEQALRAGDAGGAGRRGSDLALLVLALPAVIALLAAIVPADRL
jgi:hypothetical protein